jgi:flotillin
VELLVSGQSASDQERMIRERITGIIEGEMRAVAANMAIEEIFNDRKHFQGKVTEYIQESLNKFGCVLYNANVEELVDNVGYFTTLGQKAQEAAISTAKVAIAESKANGDIGAQDKITRALKETSRLKAETTVFENERLQSVAQSKAELQVKEAQYEAQIKIAQIEGLKTSELREAELQKEVEQKRALVETERLRAEEYAKAVVESEKIKTIADARAYEKQTLAEAQLFETQKIAEAKIFAVTKEAEGIKKLYLSQAEGLREIIKASGSSQVALQFLMLERGLYQQLAQENAKAIQGLAPKFNIWTTGKGDGDSAKPIRDIFQSLPPLLSTIQQQTGIAVPAAPLPVTHDGKSPKQ